MFKTNHTLEGLTYMAAVNEVKDMELQRINGEINKIIRIHADEGSELEKALLQLSEIVDEEIANQSKLRSMLYQVVNRL